MALKFTPQFSSIVAFLKGKDTTPEMYARLHGIAVSSVWSCIYRHIGKDENSRWYHASWNSLLSNPRLRPWLKRPEDYTPEQREADRLRQNPIGRPKPPVSRTKRARKVKQRDKVLRARNTLSRP